VLGAGCDGTRAGKAACAREAGGQWREVTLEKGRFADEEEALRWIPRKGASPLGIVDMQGAALYDPDTGRTLPLRGADGKPVDGRAARRPSGPIDRNWTARETEILAWDGDETNRSAMGKTIDAQGLAHPSARMADGYTALMVGGAFGFLVDLEGKAFITTDHGATWTEVAPPPSMAPRDFYDNTHHRCSAVGCEAFPWLRLGHRLTPPPAPAPKASAPLPSAPSPRLPTLNCMDAGDEHIEVAADAAPDERTEDLEPRFFTRDVPSPMHDDGSLPDARLLRAWVSGAPTHHESIDDPELEEDSGHFPHPPGTLRRAVGFYDAYDPAAAERLASFTVADLQAAARAAHAPPDKLFGWRHDLEGEQALPVLPAREGDPEALLFTVSSRIGRLGVLFTSGAKPRPKELDPPDRAGPLVDAHGGRRSGVRGQCRGLPRRRADRGIVARAARHRGGAGANARARALEPVSRVPGGGGAAGRGAHDQGRGDASDGDHRALLAFEG
jgi:hypothetical protein